MKASKNSKAIKIVLVEDDVFVSKAYIFFLKNAGFDVCHVDNGLGVLEAVGKHKPDIILLDLIIPGLNGFEVLAKLKKSSHKKIPVIIVSNLGQESDERTCRELGAIDFIIKSNIGMPEVIERIHKHLGR